MGSITLSIQYSKNTGLVFSPSELKSLFFTGIKLQDQDGNPIPDDTVNFYVEAAQKEIENNLSIKLTRQAYMETKDFVADDYLTWSYTPTVYMVNKPYSMKGFMNTALQITYPQEWLSAKKQSKDEDMYYRSINLVPLSGPSASVANGSLFVGAIMPYVGYYNNKVLPNYWEIKYLTGFLKIPADLLRAIGMMAAISLFQNLSDLVSGIPGQGTKSISIDGLSQSSTIQGFWKRIESYRKELDRINVLLEQRYSGIFFAAL